MAESGATLTRDDHGVVHVRAKTEADLYHGLGRAHARDRGMQMLFMRILGRGQASQHLDGSDEMFEIDCFFRRMAWHEHVDQTEVLGDRARVACEAYVDGVNAAFSERTPWELRLLGYKPDPWRIEDTYIMARMVSYLTLAQSQAEVERLFLQMLQAGVSLDKLEDLFPGNLAGLDVELLQRVKLGERFVPESVAWATGGARFAASNNWVVSGARTASGKPILANDPHLEVNRLPAVWQEVVLECDGRYAIAATMPGIPGMIIARTPDLSWGPTYTFMDAVDSWVEHCRDGRYRRGDEWIPFEVREEVIERKGRAAETVVFHENEHGVLDGDPSGDSFLLTTRWSSAHAGARSISAMVDLWDAATVEEGMGLLGRLETAFSWVLADTSGNIGFQMSGLMPKRKAGATGFVPLPGWDPENDWQGFVDPTSLPRILNPEEGFFATANHDLNAYGDVAPLNLNQGPYRAERIRAVLADNDRVTVEDMRALQHDMYSIQAERYMAILEPLLPEGPRADILRRWDRHYGADSRGAFIFERFYAALLRRVFGPEGVGEAVIDFLSEETGMFADFFVTFDRVLLSETSPWFGQTGRRAHFSAALKEALSVDPRPWGEGRDLVLSHILFGGKLPRFLGFDRGPITLIGGRSTVHQGQIFRSAGRATSFAPSIRFITDMGTDEAHTCLCGGPSDRRFSPYYCSELEDWVAGRYKTLHT